MYANSHYSTKPLKRYGDGKHVFQCFCVSPRNFALACKELKSFESECTNVSWGGEISHLFPPISYFFLHHIPLGAP